MDMKDNRKKRIVFVSLCILNQNVRFPGIATEEGACTKLVDMFMEYGLGIESLPCLECLGWGGVSRRAYFRYQPVMLRYADSLFSGFLRIIARLWVFRYGLLCRREARKVTGHIRDYLKAGYSVVGIIAMNDSPTDGVTKTINLINAPKRLKAIGFNEKMLKSPDISIMKSLINGLCEPGEGIFTSRLRKELEKKGLPIKIIGFDPWTDRIKECERIGQELGLQVG